MYFFSHDDREEFESCFRAVFKSLADKHLEAVSTRVEQHTREVRKILFTKLLEEMAISDDEKSSLMHKVVSAPEFKHSSKVLRCIKPSDAMETVTVLKSFKIPIVDYTVQWKSSVVQRSSTGASFVHMSNFQAEFRSSAIVKTVSDCFADAIMEYIESVVQLYSNMSVELEYIVQQHKKQAIVAQQSQRSEHLQRLAVINRILTSTSLAAHQILQAHHKLQQNTDSASGD
jgi:hypothetical protein